MRRFGALGCWSFGTGVLSDKERAAFGSPLPYVTLPNRQTNVPNSEVYAVSHGRAATRDEQHCKAAANRRDRYSLSDWKALRGRIGT